MRFYEVFIRTHQILALSLVLGLWQHLGSFSAFRWLFLYIYCGVFFSLHLLQAGLVLYRNVVWGKPLPRAVITQHNGAIRIQLRVSRSVNIDAGQYVGLWIPAVSLGSLFQVHPFMVTSWAEIEQDSLELFVQPRRGITSKLLRGATLDAGGASSRIALFSGPHGQGLPVWDFETVLLVATGFGIAAMLPYLRKLIRGYNLSKGRTRRIHLVWLVQNLGRFAVTTETVQTDEKQGSCRLRATYSMMLYPTTHSVTAMLVQALAIPGSVFLY